MKKQSRLIVLTGCTRGLGRELVPGFIAAGHRVIGCGTRADLIEAMQLEIGPPHDFSVVDVAQASAVKKWADRVLQSYGAPDLLLNNAAVINQPSPLWEIDPQKFADLIAVNVIGVHHVLHAFIPAMIQRGSGLIVNFSSGWGRSTSPEVAPYCASKYAIEGLTQSLAQELPPGLGAIALNPGIIDTDMLRTCWAAGAKSYPGPASWAKRAVPYLLSLSPRHNGQSLSIE